jgi:hypothetical protein
MPNWEIIQAVWPLLLGIAVLWARIEVALSKSRDQSKINEREIGKLELKVEAQAVGAALQAVQLGRIEEALTGIGRTLERLEARMANSS